MINEDIRRLQIEMDKTSTVNVSDSLFNLLESLPRLLFYLFNTYLADLEHNLPDSEVI